jgi:hypothetical protein
MSRYGKCWVEKLVNGQFVECRGTLTRDTAKAVESVRAMSGSDRSGVYRVMGCQVRQFSEYRWGQSTAWSRWVRR